MNGNSFSVLHIGKKAGLIKNINALEILKDKALDWLEIMAQEKHFFNLLLDLTQPTTGTITSNNIQVDLSEDWKSRSDNFR